MAHRHTRDHMYRNPALRRMSRSKLSLARQRGEAWKVSAMGLDKGVLVRVQGMFYDSA